MVAISEDDCYLILGEAPAEGDERPEVEKVPDTWVKDGNWNRIRERPDLMRRSR